MESKDLRLKCTTRIDWPFCRRATHNINLNLTEVLELGKLWSSASLIDFANSLTPTTPNANAGNLVGNRMFYAEDYMVGVFLASIQYFLTRNFMKVHRGSNYVTSVKMFSNRTKNTECINSQNVGLFILLVVINSTYASSAQRVPFIRRCRLHLSRWERI
jgi:hypothetical protein